MYRTELLLHRARVFTVVCIHVFCLRSDNSLSPKRSQLLLVRSVVVLLRHPDELFTTEAKLETAKTETTAPRSVVPLRQPYLFFTLILKVEASARSILPLARYFFRAASLRLRHEQSPKQRHREQERCGVTLINPMYSVTPQAEQVCTAVVF